MNGFLVLGLCPTDSIPLALFATREEALAGLRDLTPEDVARVAGVAGGFCEGEAEGVAVVEFRDGLPVPGSREQFPFVLSLAREGE